MATDPEFFALIDRSLDDPGVVAELSRRYRARVAVLVIDFTGMVARTEAAGIIYALALARAAMAAMTPALRVHGGQVIKQVADTFFVTFSDPRAALLGALDAGTALARFSEGRDDPIGASMGLGYGDCLLLPGEDVYGAEVSRAFVLGEDVGERGEVLITPAFAAAISPPPPGIGCFQAGAERAHRVGFHFSQVRDYRD